MITKEQKLAMKKSRLAILESKVKNIKCGGVVKKLRREIRNLEQEVGANEQKQKDCENAY